MVDRHLTIGELAKRAGVATSALRYYEETGLIPAPFLASRTQAVDGWRSLAHRKLAELDEQITRAQTAKVAITHARHCPHDDIATCRNFASVIAVRLAGQPLEEAHPH